MQNQPLARPPQYTIESVDSALQLLQLLRDHGSVRVKDAAEQLGVAPSTTHRLLAMLVYRGFAIQDESRVYLPGPGLGVMPIRATWTRALRDIAHPHLEALSHSLTETVNLMVRVGAGVRFLSTVQSENEERVSDRQGQVLSARLASGGKALLATVDDRVLERLYRSAGAELSGERMSDAEFHAFQRELHAIRRQGFAINRQRTERGVCAVGFAIPGADDRPIAAFSIATPVSRFEAVLSTETVALALQTRDSIHAELVEQGISVSSGRVA